MNESRLPSDNVTANEDNAPIDTDGLTPVGRPRHRFCRMGSTECVESGRQMWALRLTRLSRQRRTELHVSALVKYRHAIMSPYADVAADRGANKLFDIVRRLTASSTIRRRPDAPTTATKRWGPARYAY